MDSPQPIGDINMPVQQIELEEVKMIDEVVIQDVSDEALEMSASSGQFGFGGCGTTPTLYP